MQVSLYAISSEKLKEGLKKYKDRQSYDIDYDSSKGLLKDIDLSSIYNNCINLKLFIKGVHMSQEQFNEFCNTIPLFVNLKCFQFRFYNKFVQNIDQLLINVQNIDTVELNLKFFKKINLEQMFTSPVNIKQLKLNLVQATFKKKNNSISYLQSYISRLHILESFTIKLTEDEQVNLLQFVPKQAKSIIDLSHHSNSIQICDQIISSVNENKLENVYIDKGSYFLMHFLQMNGIKLTEKLINQLNLQIDFNARAFQKQDFQHLLKIPQFSTILKDFYQTKLIIYIRKCQLNDLFEYLITPFCLQFPNIAINFDYTIYKNNNKWIQTILDDHNIKQLSPFAMYIININLILKYIKPYDFKISLVKIIKILKKSEYLVSYGQYTSDGLDYKTYENRYTNKQLDLLKDLNKLSSEITQTRLRYITFFRQYSDLIPIPQQIFFDLIYN